MIGNIITSSFNGPAGLASWIILLLTLLLVAPVVVFSGFIKNLWGYALSLGLALLPLFVGVSGSVYSLYEAKKALIGIPGSLYTTIKALGDYVSLSSVFFGAVPTLILWSLSLITFLIACRKRSGKEAGGQDLLGVKRSEFFLVSASFVFIPALAGMTGIYYGLILKAYAVVNISVKQRGAVVSEAEAFKNYSGVSGFILAVLFIMVSMYLWKKRYVETSF